MNPISKNLPEILETPTHVHFDYKPHFFYNTDSTIKALETNQQLCSCTDYLIKTIERFIQKLFCTAPKVDAPKREEMQAVALAEEDLLELAKGQLEKALRSLLHDYRSIIQSRSPKKLYLSIQMGSWHLFLTSAINREDLNNPSLFLLEMVQKFEDCLRESHKKIENFQMRCCLVKGHTNGDLTLFKSNLKFVLINNRFRCNKNIFNELKFDTSQDYNKLCFLSTLNDFLSAEINLSEFF